MILEDEVTKGDRGKSDSSSDNGKGKGKKSKKSSSATISPVDRDESMKSVSMGVGHVHMTAIQVTTTAMFLGMALLAVLWCALRPVYTWWVNQEYDKVGDVAAVDRV